ncbi:MAG TPA: PfkB family carbohydrate kinase [Variovorax sp.]|nr:PfkB family carbohydrate kinase [Variovorax sp.]
MNIQPAQPSRAPSALVFGEALIDLFEQGPVVGGAPFNVARHLQGLGLAACFVSRIGVDEGGTLIAGELARRGMSTAALQTDPIYPTGLVRVHQEAPGEHSFEIVADAAWDHIEAAALPLAHSEVVQAGWLYYGSLALRSPASHMAWQRLCIAHEGQRYMDLNWREGNVPRSKVLHALGAADVAKVNSDELAMLMRWHGLQSRAEAMVLHVGETCTSIGDLLEPLSVARLIVTYGHGGYAAYDRRGQCIASGPGRTGVALVDTVGAGDAFSSVVLAGFILGWKLPLALERANEFAAAVCEVRGAMPHGTQFHHHWRHHWRLD